MKIEIESDHPTLFVNVDIEHDGKTHSAIVQLHGGTWMLSRSGGMTWLASGKLSWQEALKRALLKLETEIEGII